MNNIFKQICFSMILLFYFALISKPESTAMVYGYDPVGNRDRMEFNLDGTAGFEIKTTYIYDTINRLTELIQQGTTGQLASYNYSLADDGQRISLDENIKLTGGTTETHNITYGYDQLNRLTDETADSSGSGYDANYTYDVVGNRTLREITVNSQPLTTEYTYYPGTDKLHKETHTGPVYSFYLYENDRYYAYAAPNGGFFYRDAQGRTIGGLQAFFMGLPSVWSQYLFILAMALVPILLLGPAVKADFAPAVLLWCANTFAPAGPEKSSSAHLRIHSPINHLTD